MIDLLIRTPQNIIAPTASINIDARKMTRNYDKTKMTIKPNNGKGFYPLNVYYD